MYKIESLEKEQNVFVIGAENIFPPKYIA